MFLRLTLISTARNYKIKMSDIKFICMFYSLVTCFTLQTTQAVPGSFQIDEFIKQLMSSDKFDELTDLIADKAAQKIKGIGDKATRTSSIALREHEEEDDKKSNERVKFGLKLPQTKNERSGNTQFKHDKIKYKDSKSDENVFGRDYKKHNNFKSVRNIDSSHEINEDSSEKYKGSIETNKGSRKDKSSWVKNKNDHEEKKNTSHESNKSDSTRNKNTYTRSKEEKIVSAEKWRWQENQSQKFLRTREYRSEDKNKEINIKDDMKLENISKIDTQALLNSHINSKELELNFKHIKGVIQRHNAKESSEKLNKNYDKRKHSNEDNFKTTNKHEGKNDDDRNIKNKRHNTISKESSIETKKHEQSSFHSTDKNKYTQVSQLNDSNDENSENEETKRSKKVEDHTSKEKPIARLGNPTNDSEEVNKTDEEEINNAKLFIDRVMDRVSKELRNPTYAPIEVAKETKKNYIVSKEVVVVGLESKRSEESEAIHSDSSEKPKRSKNTPSQRKIFREENGKKFTYQSSAEYADYHENLANAQKPKYFNTY